MSPTLDNPLDQSLGDEPIEEKHREQMLAVAQGLDQVFNNGKTGKDRTTGFVVLVFNMNENGMEDPRCNFISNGADRKDLIALFKEMIARFEGQPKVEGNA